MDSRHRTEKHWANLGKKKLTKITFSIVLKRTITMWVAIVGGLGIAYSIVGALN